MSINPQTERKEIFTGARVRLKMAGARVGWASGISGGREYVKTPVDVLGNLETEEFATTAYRINFRASMVGIVSRSLVNSGFLPLVGQDSEAHVKAAVTLEGFTVEVEDIVTGKVTHEFHDMEISAESFTLQAGGVMMNDVSMVGKTMLDVKEAS